MRSPSSTDFTIDVPEIGVLTFAKRTRRDNFAIGAEYHRLTNGTEPGDTYFGYLSQAQATLDILLVDATETFKNTLDIDKSDPLDATIETNIIAAFVALCNKEQAFRKTTNKVVKAESTADAGHDGVLVSEEVQSNSQ